MTDTLNLRLAEHGYVLCHRAWLDQAIPYALRGPGGWEARWVDPDWAAIPDDLREEVIREIEEVERHYGAVRAPALWEVTPVWDEE